MTDTVRTVQRGYPAGSPRRSDLVRRVHVIREDGPRGWDEGGTHTWCGQLAGRHVNSEPLIREAPHPLPEGLAWCPKCVGHLAEQLGRLEEMARILGLEPA